MNFLDLISQLQPFIIIALIIVMLGFENIWPYLSTPANKKKHELRNFILAFISFAVNGVAGFILLQVLKYVGDYKLGLLNNLPVSPALHLALGIVLIDFFDYSGHVLVHKTPLLWRFHRVHHSDPNVMTSSSLRFHPFDILYSQLLVYAIAITILGVSSNSFIIYGTIGVTLLILQHSNVKFPAWMEKYGKYIFVTPGFHKIHHASEQQYTDSHYATVFTFWDRMFGTYHEITPEQITYGLQEFDTDKKQTLGYLLSVPFRNLKRQ